MRFDIIALVSTVLGGAAASVINGPVNPRDIDVEARDFNELYKRRGGGGGGGRGGGGSGGSKSGGSKSGGSKSGSGSGSSSGSKNTGSKSTSGGSTSKGSGPQPSYLGGRYYGGGASTPYRAGGRSPGGIAPVFLGAGALAFWPGIWLYGAHTYPYGHHRNGDDDDGYWYEYHNVTTDDDERREVICACSQYSECSCDKSDEADEYLDELVGNGSYAALNKTLINVAKVNGTMTLLINGTLPNGTTVASAAGDSMQTMAQALGFWPAIAAVGAAVFLS